MEAEQEKEKAKQKEMQFAAMIEALHKTNN